MAIQRAREARLDLDLVGTRCSGSLTCVVEPVKEAVRGARFTKGFQGARGSASLPSWNARLDVASPEGRIKMVHCMDGLVQWPLSKRAQRARTIGR
jgi:hypothetical protein